MLKYKICILFICGILLVSCSTGPTYQDVSDNTTYQTLDFPPAVYNNLVWFKDQPMIAFLGFVVGDRSVPSSNDYDLSHNPYAIEGDGQIHDFEFELADNCTQAKFYYPESILPDGRLGMLMECGRTLPQKTVHMFAYDWPTGKSEPILNYPMPNPMRSGCFSWNPKMTRAIQSTSDGMTGGLYWLTQKGPEPLDLVITKGNKSWDLAKSYASDGSKDDGIAKCPQWSPDGEHIFFPASLDAMGFSGFSRLNRNFDLYDYSVNTKKIEVLLQNILSPTNLRLSPDGEKIAYMRTNDDKQTTSVWVFRLKDKKLFRIISKGYFHDMQWSADSKDIAAVWCNDIRCTSSEIRRYSFILPDAK